jgi:hypothetical protein
MTSRDVSDEQLGQLARRYHDLFRRVREGSVPIDVALKGLQALIEGGELPTRESPPLLEGKHYRIHVDYSKPTDFEALEQMFSGKHSVSRVLKRLDWIDHETIDETPGERDFLVVQVPSEFIVTRDVIDNTPLLREADIYQEREEGLRKYFECKGYRFANLVEAIKFSQAQPHLQRAHRIFPLGTSVCDGNGQRSFMYLTMRNKGYDRALRVTYAHEPFRDRSLRAISMRKWNYALLLIHEPV